MTSKNIIVDLNKCEKLDGTNYSVWQRKITYLLNEQEVLDNLDIVMEEPEMCNLMITQHRQNMQEFLKWKKKERCARFTMLSGMHNDLIGEFEDCLTAKHMWDEIKLIYGNTSATKLRTLTYKFESYKIDQKRVIPEQLHEMSEMTRELKAVGCILSNDQQVQAVIRSLSDSWSSLRRILTHTNFIQTFADGSRHVELETECHEANRAISVATRELALVSLEGPRRPHGQRKKQAKAKKTQNLGPRGDKIAKRRRGKKNIAKQKCYNCGTLSHFVRACPKPKKTQAQPNM